MVGTWIQMSRSPEYSPKILSEMLRATNARIGIDDFDDALNGETIIMGGYLNTRLIQAKSIYADMLNVRDLSAISADIGDITSGSITGTEINNGNGTFRVDTSGNLKATNADIKGKITATSGSFTGSINSRTGEVGRWEIANYGMYNDTLRAGFITHPYSNVVLYVGNATYAGMLDDIEHGSDYSLPYFWVSRDGSITTLKDLYVEGSKQRIVNTKNYGTVGLNAYETPRPTFADTGHGIIAEDGFCYVVIDSIFLETIDTTHEYNHFLTKYGQGDLWVRKDLSTKEYFVVEGTPNLEFSWKIEAIQRDYNTYNLEKFEGIVNNIEETDYEELASKYLESYEKELMPA